MTLKVNNLIGFGSAAPSEAGIWVQVGNGLPITGVGSGLAIAAMTSTRIAFFDTSQRDLRAYDWDSSDWAQIGNDKNIPGANGPGLAALSSTRVAFADISLNTLTTYDFDGADWTKIGNSLALSMGSPSMGALSASRIAFFDSSNDDMRVYDFDGADWTQTGNDLVLAGATGVRGAGLRHRDRDAAQPRDPRLEWWALFLR